MNQPILQFGTSRFLLAHAALFVSEAMEAGQGQRQGQEQEDNQALGGITVVQTTDNPQSAARVAAFSDPQWDQHQFAHRSN